MINLMILGSETKIIDSKNKKVFKKLAIITFSMYTIIDIGYILIYIEKAIMSKTKVKEVLYMTIIMLGAPGTGKGTVAGILSEKLDIPQVSTGDIFRKNIKEQTELGKLANEYISKGNLVPDEVTIDIVKDRLKQDDVQKGIILDGFPRTVKQAEALDEILKQEGKEVDIVINLETPEEEIIERIVNRRVCSNQECKTVYNLILNTPKKENVCDKCGAELVQRADDNVETVKSRFRNYIDQTSPLVEYYTKTGKLQTELVSKSVNKLGKDVAEDIVNILKK